MSTHPAPRQPRLTALFIAIAAAAAVLALLVGLEGSLVANGALWAGGISLVLAWVYPWRDPKRFARLALGSLLALVVCVVLHNLLYALGQWLEAVPVVPFLLEVLHVGFFLIGVYLCPAGLLVGVLGTVAVVLARGR